MNYTNIYNSLIEKGKSLNHVSGVYYEKHHIVPKCIGGNNTKENLVNLTPEEHYIAHQLLAKIYPDNKHIICAAVMMCVGRPNNKLYGWLRRRHGQTQSERMTTSSHMLGKNWISNENETVLIDRDVAISKVEAGEYIFGKTAKRDKCGHLVKEHCISCKSKKRNAYDLKKEKAKELALKLFEEFKTSGCESIGEYAKITNTTQPRLSALWKKYVPEYNEKRQQGKRFLK